MSGSGVTIQHITVSPLNNMLLTANSDRKLHSVIVSVLKLETLTTYF